MIDPAVRQITPAPPMQYDGHDVFIDVDPNDDKKLCIRRQDNKTILAVGGEFGDYGLYAGPGGELTGSMSYRGFKPVVPELCPDDSSSQGIVTSTFCGYPVEIRVVRANEGILYMDVDNQRHTFDVVSVSRWDQSRLVKETGAVDLWGVEVNLRSGGSIRLSYATYTTPQ